MATMPLFRKTKKKSAVKVLKARPCPFCGKKATIRDLTANYVRCENNVCRVKPMTDNDFKTLDIAIAWWNGDRAKKSKVAK